MQVLPAPHSSLAQLPSATLPFLEGQAVLGSRITLGSSFHSGSLFPEWHSYKAPSTPSQRGGQPFMAMLGHSGKQFPLQNQLPEQCDC